MCPRASGCRTTPEPGTQNRYAFFSLVEELLPLKAFLPYYGFLLLLLLVLLERRSDATE